jgi:hypothetical protein
MSEEKDSVDEAWDDVPGAEPKPAEPAKPAGATSKPPSEPPKPASTPPRPASGSPPRPASNPPAQASSTAAQPARPASNSGRETASTRPEGIAAVGTGTSASKRTLIGIPAPVVEEKTSEKLGDTPSDKPPEKTSDKPPEKTSDKPASIHDSVPAAKRTLIGIAAPVIAPKATPSVQPSGDQKATPPEPWRASQAPIAMSSPPTESTRDEPSLPPPPPAEEQTPRAKKPLSQTTRKETPDALAAAKAQARSTRGRISSAPPEAEKSSRLGPILLVAILGAGAIWFLVSKQRSMSEPVIETVPAPTPVAEQTQPEKPPEPIPAPPPEPAAAPTPEPLASAAPPSSASADTAADKSPKAEKPSPAEPTPAADTGAASAEGARVVTVHLTPPDAQLFYKGKSVGKSPVRIELEAGEKKRSFEVGRPGFVTRRLIVDGSQAVVWIGLRPESAAPAPSE